MTPISFALEILLDCETIEEAHKKCRKYIKLLEGREVKISGNVRLPANLQPGIIVNHPGPPPNLQQSPSTLAAMARHAGEAMTAPQTPRVAVPVIPPGAPVSTGNGTIGPKKW